MRFVEFFNRAKLLYDVIGAQGACTPETCKDFKASQCSGQGYFEYRWADPKDPVYKVLCIEGKEINHTQKDSREKGVSFCDTTVVSFFLE